MTVVIDKSYFFQMRSMRREIDRIEQASEDKRRSINATLAQMMDEALAEGPYDKLPCDTEPGE